MNRHASAATLWGIVAFLAGANVLPAAYSWQLVASYAAIPRIRTQQLRDIRMDQPGVRPIIDGQGLAVTSDGAIYVVDLNGGRVLVFPDGTSTSGSLFAPRPGDPALREPFSLAVGPGERLYLLERATGNVVLFDRSGARVRVSKLGSPGARALAVDSAGSVFVGDTGSGVIRKFDAGGSPDSAWGDGTGQGLTRVGGVIGLAVMGNELYAASSTAQAVVHLSAAGRIVESRASRGGVGILAADPGGRLFMSDLAANRVWMLDARASTVALLEGASGEPEIFGQPRGLVATAEGLLYAVNDNHVTAYQMLWLPAGP